MIKIIDKPTTNYDITNKKYVDETLQSDYEFKVFQQTSSQSGVNSFDKQVTIEEGWIPLGFFTVGTEGAVGYGYQSYPTELVSPTKVRCRGWCNINGGTHIKIWLPCYRKKLAKNLLAYTTRDSLWTGNFTGDATCNLGGRNWKDYDYLDFRMVNEGSRLWDRVYVSNLIEALTNKAQQLEPRDWNGTDRRLIIFANGSSDTALKININGSLYLQEIIGYRVVPEKDFHLYEHNICCWENSNKSNGICFKIINNNQSPFTSRQELGQWCIKNNCYNNQHKALQGYFQIGKSGNVCVYFVSATTMYCFASGWGNTTWGNSVFEDNVRVI